MITLNAPAHSGYKKDFDTVAQAKAAAAELLGIDSQDMVEVEDSQFTTYCYGSEVAAEADRDGAYAIKYFDAK